MYSPRQVFVCPTVLAARPVAPVGLTHRIDLNLPSPLERHVNCGDSATRLFLLSGDAIRKATRSPHVTEQSSTRSQHPYEAPRVPTRRRETTRSALLLKETHQSLLAIAEHPDVRPPRCSAIPVGQYEKQVARKSEKRE